MLTSVASTTVGLTPLILGIGTLQLGLMFLFTLSSGFVFTVIKGEVGTKKGFGVAGGVWAFSIVLSFFML